MTKKRAIWLSSVLIIGFSSFVIYLNRDSFLDKQETKEPKKEDSSFSIRFLGEIQNTDIKIVEIDSCEYLISGVGSKRIMTHKGNCKYCIERNKKLYGIQ